MDFRGRSQSERVVPAQPTSNLGSAASSQPSSGSTSQLGKISKQPVGKLFKLASVLLLFGVTALVIALTFLLVFGGNGQARAIQKNKYQAVFLNNGQVYFGNIKGIGSKTFDLQNIYYLQTSGGTASTTQETTASNVSLVKLGCELHSPYDRMLINSDQVIFWENLQDSGQVVKAIADYKKQNATQTCSTASQNSTQQAPSTTPATPQAATPTPTPTPTKKP